MKKSPPFPHAQTKIKTATTPLPLSGSKSSIRDLLASNRFGTFFGVSQKVLDSVWQALTSPASESVTYISMEIGADLDVFHPVRKRLEQLEITEHSDEAINRFLQLFLHGPVKIPNYSGGLGILAGDTLKSFADCKIPVVGISLLYRKGYFSQMVDSKIGQVAWASHWEPENTPGLYLLRDPQTPDQPLTIKVPFYGHQGIESIACAHLWLKMEINETLDFFVPEILLDYQTSQSPDWIQKAAQHLYDSSSEKVKATQRKLLGAGVLPVMKALGLTSRTIHLNEQHGVGVILSLIEQFLQEKYGHQYEKEATDHDILTAAAEIAKRLVFTIHTPVKAGHDRFNISTYDDLINPFNKRILHLLALDEQDPSIYNFTALAMKLNRATNSVSRLHKEVTRQQFPQYADKITAITNGVHHLTWTSDARAKLYDTFPELNNWRKDPGVFAGATALQQNNKFRTYFEQAWQTDTRILVDYVNRMLNTHRNQRLKTWIDPPNYLSCRNDGDAPLEHTTFTLGFARRFSTYKRADLIFADLDRLAAIITKNNWPVNFIYAGKAHPEDEPGKDLIKNVLAIQEELYLKSHGLAKLVFIPGYDMSLAKMMIAGSHAWLNSPKRPLEASGTSGMKAALNGVPNVSIMDGWWVEGYHNGQTGWKFGHEKSVASEHLSEQSSSLLYDEDSDSFYGVLPEMLRLFYDPALRAQYIEKCLANLILNCPIFNTHRMTAEYVARYDLELTSETQQKMIRFSKLYCSDPAYALPFRLRPNNTDRK